MRRYLALLAALALIHAAAGCRHVAGGCDCEHAVNPSYTGRDSVGQGRGCCGATAAPMPGPVGPVAPMNVPSGFQQMPR